MPEPRTVVTLVHGTFARGSRWKDLEYSLRYHLPKPVLFRYFNWSGGLSLRARRRAVERLRRTLRRRTSALPNATHILIAHSHGGNIAARALDRELRSKFTEVICLSTPFLVTAVREDDAPLPTLLALFGISFWISLAILWSGVPLSIAVTTLVGLCWFGRRAIWAQVDKAHAVSRELAFPELSARSIRIVRSPSDEATVVLSVVQFATAMLQRIVDLAAGLFVFPHLIRDFPNRFITEMMVVPVAYIAVFCLGLILSLLMPILLFIACAPTALVGGLELALTGVWLDTTIEQVPPGHSEVTLLPHTGVRRRRTYASLLGFHPLSHSRTYLDDTAIDQLLFWLKPGYQSDLKKRDQHEAFIKALWRD